jgi:peptide/nickel transport system permease protein
MGWWIPEYDSDVMRIDSKAPALKTTDYKRLWRTFIRNRLAVVGLVLVILLVCLSIAAPIVAPGDPFEQDTATRLRPPSQAHPLGQDTYGRDIFARLLHAGRVSLLVGVCSVLLGGTIGTIIGLVAGFAGGRVENILMRLVDIIMVFPSLLLGLVVLAVLGTGLFKMVLAVGVVLSPAFARVAHGSTLSIKQQEFVVAARSVGAGRCRIVFVHVLPNILGEIVVLGSIWTANAIRVEANLSFIGLGVSPPTPTWGNMIREGASHLVYAPWLSVFAGAAILVSVLAFNLLGDGLRDVLDPRQHR